MLFTHDMVKHTLLSIYEKNYKQLIFLSFFLLIICFLFLGNKYLKTGEFVGKGVSLKGGITLTIPVEEAKDITFLENSLKKAFPQSDINTRTITQSNRLLSIIIEASDVEEASLINEVKKIIPVEKDKYTVEFIGSSLGKSFFKQTIRAVIIAFISMAIVVFITFKHIVPSLILILASFNEIVSTLAVVSFLEVKLSTAGIAAFLMLIGYSVDTNILLTTRVLQRSEGTIFERTVGAFKTGLTMSLTALAAVSLGYFLTDSDVIKNIMLILMIGLLFDIPYTWMQNAGILRWYLEKKHGQT